MYDFFLGLQKYLPSFTPDFASRYLAEADSLPDLERRQRLIESIKHSAFAG